MVVHIGDVKCRKCGSSSRVSHERFMEFSIVCIVGVEFKNRLLTVPHTSEKSIVKRHVPLFEFLGIDSEGKFIQTLLLLESFLVVNSNNTIALVCPPESCYSWKQTHTRHLITNNTLWCLV